MTVQPRGQAAAAGTAETPRPAARVAMLSDRLWSPRHWNEGGMSLVGLAPAALERWWRQLEAAEQAGRTTAASGS